MYLNRILALLAAGTMCAAVAAAEPEKKGAESPDDVVCTYVSKTGSHLKQRVCESRAQRDARAEADREAMQRLQQGRSGASNRDSAPIR